MKHLGTEIIETNRLILRRFKMDDSENMYREEVLYYTAMSSYKYASLRVPSKQKERFMLFIDDYFNFVGEYPESKHRRELDSLYKRVKNNETSASDAPVK